MSNVVFELFAKLGLDSSEYEKGLNQSKSLAGSVGGAIGNGLKTMAKVGVAAIGTATAAVGAFATSSVKTGAEFDKSMSQVAATMGFTTEQLNATEEQLASMTDEERKAAVAAQESFGQLRDFAQEMGRTTAFSASQASEALNYMALAGYDVETSMTMLPNVLNLAAAGNMDLATASDMVTDAQSALGLTLDETSAMVDQMAKTSSKTNTSVAQLGEAMLTIGATARGVKGGTVELSSVLGVLADNGIKGAEGGTHLRNAILSLQTPTKDGVAALKQLGMTYDDMYDASGNLRSLPEIFQQMSTAMDGMTQQSKDAIISGVFNKTDLAAVNALIGTNAKRWDEVTAEIEDSKGAAQAMADTQLDNLAGDVTLFQSALEGAKIAVSDGLTPTLRKFVQFGTDGLSKITDAFQKGGISGAMAEFGTILSDGIAMITKMLPDAINAGMKLLGAVGQGILDNLPVIIDAAVQIINQLVQGIVTALPYLVEGALQIILGLANGISQMLPTLIPTIIEVMLQIVQTLIDNISLLYEGAIQLAIGLANGLINALPVIIKKLPELVMGIVTALIENLPLLLEAQVQIMIALAQAIIENLPLFIDACVQILVAIGQLLAQYGANFLSFVIQNLQQLVTNVGNGMRDMFNTVVNWLSQLPAKMAYYAGYAIGEFIKFVIQLPSKVSSIFTSVISNTASFGTNFANKAREMASNFFNNVVNGIASLPSRVAELGSQLVQAVANLPSKFAEIGSNIVQGIWNGISNGWNWLTDKVSDLANSLLQGAKDALGIASPSKEFAYVGRMVDAGFAKGLDNYSYLIEDALDDIINIPDANAIVGDLTLNSNANKANAGFTQVNNIYSPTPLTPYEVARQTRNATRDMVLALNMGG